MRIIPATTRLEYPVCLVLGNFDGVHLGHQAVLAKAGSYAKAHGIQTAVLGFDPHPLKVLAPERAPKLLQTPMQKVRLLAGCGVDFYLPVPFDDTMARRSPEQFVAFLMEKAVVRHVLVGFNFRFGHRREGDVACLRQLTGRYGVTLGVTAGITDKAGPISSSRIRNLVQEGRLLEAAELLGRPYFLEGQVIEGRRLGRKLGVPTANMLVENECLPRFGVYASWALLNGNEWRRAITNVGMAPTVNEAQIRVETHVLDFHKDLYQQPLQLCLGTFIRSERRFNSVDLLKQQIQEDICNRRALPDLEPPQFHLPVLAF